MITVYSVSFMEDSNRGPSESLYLFRSPLPTAVQKLSVLYFISMKSSYKWGKAAKTWTPSQNWPRSKSITLYTQVAAQLVRDMGYGSVSGYVSVRVAYAAKEKKKRTKKKKRNSPIQALNTIQPLPNPPQIGASYLFNPTHCHPYTPCWVQVGSCLY